MKKLLFMLLMVLFLFGCGPAATQSEFAQHNSQYATWEHLKFSWWEYKNPTKTTLKESKEQNWWGIEIPYIPAE